MQVTTRQVALEHNLLFWESLHFSHLCYTCSSIFNSVAHCLMYSSKCKWFFFCLFCFLSIQWLTYLLLLISVNKQTKKNSYFHQSFLWKICFFKTSPSPPPSTSWVVFPSEIGPTWYFSKKSWKQFDFVYISLEKYFKILLLCFHFIVFTLKYFTYITTEMPKSSCFAHIETKQIYNREKMPFHFYLDHCKRKYLRTFE